MRVSKSHACVSDWRRTAAAVVNCSSGLIMATPSAEKEAEKPGEERRGERTLAGDSLSSVQTSAPANLALEELSRAVRELSRREVSSFSRC